MKKYQKILVTGSAGFIGHATCKRLLREGYQVVGLDNINDYYTVDLKYDRLVDMGFKRKEAEVFGRLCASEQSDRLSFVRMDLQDREALPKLFAEQPFDAVINLAAQAGVRYSLENPESYIDSNIVGFLNVLECCRHHETKHLVYASSSSVYGENKKVPFAEEDRVDYPVSLYAATKKSDELMAHTYSHLYSLPTSGLRFFTVYGPWGRPDMAPMLFASAIVENRPIKVFNHGEMKRDFTYIDDIVEGILITLNNPPIVKREGDEETKREGDKEMGRQGEGENVSSPTPPLTPSPSHPLNHSPSQLFNIGNGAPVHLMHFIETMEKALGKEAKKVMMDMQPGDVPQTWADTSRLQKLGYKSTTDIEEGVQRFVEWFKKYGI